MAELLRSTVIREVLKSNLSDPVKVLVVGLAELADWNTCEGFASQATIASAINKTDRTVRSLEVELRSEGSPVRLVRHHDPRESGRGRASHYRLKLRDQPEDVDPVEGATNRKTGIRLNEGPTGRIDATNRKNSDDQPEEFARPTGSLPSYDHRDHVDHVDQDRAPADASTPPAPPTSRGKGKEARRRGSGDGKPKASARKPKPKPTKPTTPGHAEVMAHYAEAFGRRRGVKPVLGGAEGTAIKNLLGKLNGDVTRARAIIDNALGSWCGDTVTILVIARDPSRFAAPAPAKPNGRRAPEPQPAAAAGGWKPPVWKGPEA